MQALRKAPAHRRAGYSAAAFLQTGKRFFSFFSIIPPRKKYHVFLLCKAANLSPHNAPPNTKASVRPPHVHSIARFGKRGIAFPVICPARYRHLRKAAKARHLFCPAPLFCRATVCTFWDALILHEPQKNDRILCKSGKCVSAIDASVCSSLSFREFLFSKC